MRRRKKTSDAKTGPGLLSRLHRDDKGAISVLTLLSIWCLIALAAMVWNTTEAAMRRQHLQAAADSAAHSAATWQTRAVNAVAAQNMVIAQDAAAHTIWKAVPPTIKALDARLDRELQRIQQLRNGLQQNRNRINALIDRIAVNHALLEQALSNVSSNIASANITDANDRTTFTKQVRQAGVALKWVDSVYVNAPAGGGGPAPGGKGLVPYAQEYVQKAIDKEILDLIEDTINNKERPIVREFESKTAPAVQQPLDQRAQDHEREVYASQQDLLFLDPANDTDATRVAQTIEEQRAKLAEFYKADITLATVQNDGTSAGSAPVFAPLARAGDVSSETWVDTIRSRYPTEAAQVFGTPDPTVTIDAVNPSTDTARVWHPNVVLNLPGLARSFTMDCNTTGGWGHIWAMPIERYYTERVVRDQTNLDVDYMQRIDKVREELLQEIIKKMGGQDIAPIPATTPDDQPNEKGVIEQIPILPGLSLPGNTKPTSRFQAQLDLYKLLAPQYMGDISDLRMLLRAEQYSYFYLPFASITWHNQVARARDEVIQELGTNKTFMVLSTYKLRYIPDGAIKEQLRGAAQAAIWAEIVRKNNPRILGLIRGSMRGANTAQVAAAATLAIEAMETSAWTVASTIADEWVARPWPYEIEPPKDSDPWPRGLGKDDRQQYFTIVAAARPQAVTNTSAPKFLLPKIFEAPKLVAYAQAETFNWMEFHPSYGGTERYDAVSWIHYNQGFDGVPVPRCWRLSTVAGWSWQPRLSVSDALSKTLENNPELQTYLNDAGYSTSDPDALETINLH